MESGVYLQKIEKIIGAEFDNGELRLNLTCDTYEEARELMHRLRNMQKELRSLKRDSNQTIKEIRSEFATEKTMVGKGIGSAFAVGLLGRRAVGGFNSIRRDELRNARDDAIAPYTEIKNMIDSIVHQIDQKKFTLENSELYKNKPSPRKTKPQPKSGLKEKSKNYFINLKGDIKGPMTIQQIEGLLAAHVADGDTLLCIEGEIDWHPMKHFFEVSG